MIRAGVFNFEGFKRGRDTQMKWLRAVYTELNMWDLGATWTWWLWAVAVKLGCSQVSNLFFCDDAKHVKM